MDDHRPRPDRRRVLAALTALPLGWACRPTSATSPSPSPTPDPTTTPTGPAPDRAPEPPPWEPDEPVDEAAFPFGVAAGDATAEGVLLSVRARGVDTVGLRVMAGVDGGWEEAVTEAAIPVVEGTAQIEVAGLQADQVYRYVFLTPDGQGRTDVGRFRTALSGDSPARKLVIGATSCLGGSNPTFPSLQHAAEQDLDVFLLLGDTVYADGALTVEDYRAVWDEQLAVPAVRALLASTSVVATWDDHEVSNNWTYGEPGNFQDQVTPDQVLAGTRAFQEAIPQRVPEDGPAWRLFTWGDVLEIVVMDCRGERDWDQQIVSEAQLAAVTERLRTSPARFKLVLVSVHMTDHLALMGPAQAEDRWQGYPAQRDAVLAAAEEGGGVVFVTGDMHYGAIQRVSPDGALGAEIYEVAAGPAGSELFPVEQIAALFDEVPAQYEVLVEDWSWARIELDPGTGEVWVQLIDDQRAVVGERRFTP